MKRLRQFMAFFSVYTQRPILVMALLGFSSGLPLLLTASTLSLRMREQGIDIKTIGLFSLVGLPYVFKFLWAPLFDTLSIPKLTSWLGRRRASLLLIQVLLIGSVVTMGAVKPSSIWLIAWAAFLVSFLSASQDIVIDALRIEMLPPLYQATGLATFITSYRLAMMVSFTGSILFVEFVRAENLAHSLHNAWFFAHIFLGCCLGLGVIATCLAHENLKDFTRRRNDAPFFVRLNRAVISPFQTFIQRPSWLYILLFIIFYKMGDIFTGHMLIPFIVDKGYSSKEYALINSSIGLLFGFLGNFSADFLIRLGGLFTAVLVAGLLQNLVNVVFALLNILPHSLFYLTLALSVENFFWNMGSVVFVTWLSRLCSHREFTATEYALLTAISAIGRTTFPASSGYFVDWMGYSAFFMLTVVLGLPSLFFFARIKENRKEIRQ